MKTIAIDDFNTDPVAHNLPAPQPGQCEVVAVAVQPAKAAGATSSPPPPPTRPPSSEDPAPMRPSTTPATSPSCSYRAAGSPPP
jgi:hypothetical protein